MVIGMSLCKTFLDLIVTFQVNLFISSSFCFTAGKESGRAEIKSSKLCLQGRGQI